METVREILAKSTDYLAGRNVESPRLEAEVLLAHALGIDRLKLYMQIDRPLNRAELDAMRDCLRQRSSGVPNAYVTGRREFYSLDFAVTLNVLIPRPATESLVDEALKFLRKREAPRFLDLGTGSGCIALAVLKNAGQSRAVAVDISEDALAVARRNAGAHGLLERVEFLAGDFYSALGDGQKFDLIVSNPPYVAEGEYAGLQVEVKKEPVRALVGGVTGLECYEKILARAAEFLVPDGRLMFEIGDGRHAALAELAESHGYVVTSTRDFQGLFRVMILAPRA